MCSYRPFAGIIEGSEGFAGWQRSRADQLFMRRILSSKATWSIPSRDMGFCIQEGSDGDHEKLHPSSQG